MMQRSRVPMRHQLYLAFVALALAACSGDSRTSTDSLLVRVSADAADCTVNDVKLLCSKLVTHLTKTLAIPPSRPIVLGDQKTGRNDPQLIMLASDLRAAGYSQITRVGMASEPR